MSGKHEVDLDTNIWKLRLNSNGYIISTEYLSDLVEKEHTAHKRDDEKDHHEGHKMQHQGFDQEAEDMIKKVKHSLASGEGCRIFERPTHVNVSHIIHDLSFGPKYPGIHNPLDGTSRILHGASGTFKYYIKIVPTEYKYLLKEVLPTNQFSVTEYFSPIYEFDRTWPGMLDRWMYRLLEALMKPNVYSDNLGILRSA